MSLPSELLPVGLLGATTGGYQISRSLRFNSSDSAYLSRTPASAGNRKTWTWAGWVKRSKLGTTQTLFSTNGSGDTTLFQFEFSGGDALRLAGSVTQWAVTSSVYRDTSAWYHIVLATDTTQATSSNRFRIYVNGSLVSTYSATSYPSQNQDLGVNDNRVHYIGAYFNTTPDFNGYLADIHFIDGQALDPTSFGEFDTNGIWQPKRYSGTYGTNGFKLDFADNSSNTATTLGKDTSGNGNNWLPNNLSVTAGAGNDSLVDVPTNGVQPDTGAGGEVRGNYPTLNPLDISERYVAGSSSIQNGNLTINCPIGSTWVAHATFMVPSSGKWYFEATCDSPSPISNGAYVGALNIFYANNGNRYKGGWGAYGASYSTGDIIGVAVNADSLQITFYKNGVSQGVLAGDAAETFIHIGGERCVFTANFGQRAFAYQAPSGFKALNTANLPTPTILDGSDYMDVVTYTGNGSTQTISGLEFSPDLVWIKSRNATYWNELLDSVRGVNKSLYSNATDAEASYTSLTAFNSDGFTVANNGVTNQGTNALNQPFVAWCWDAGSSTVTNTQGSITSSVRANASAGFSVLTYTGTGGTATVGHGLGIAPSFILIKERSPNTDNWNVYHASLGASAWLQLNLTNATSTGSEMWNSTSPTSTVVTVRNPGSGGYSNRSGAAYVAYCFAPVDSYSSFGSYTGNGSTDGPFIFCGFRPRWVLAKRTDSTGDWILTDSTRNTFNVVNELLKPNLGDATETYSQVDFLSNGFKVRNTGTNMNANGGTYVYAAFAENPFSVARAR